MRHRTPSIVWTKSYLLETRVSTGPMNSSASLRPCASRIGPSAAILFEKHLK